MAVELVALAVAARDPAGLARFWGELLGLQPVGGGTAELLPRDGIPFRLRFVESTEAKAGPNHMHPDLTSGSLEDQALTVERALALGGRHIDVGQLPEEEHVVLADPEGNELCVIEPGNGFTAGCGVIGQLSCDGSQAVGYFWRDALGWSLVWDEGEETAVQSPSRGSKIAWGGPPLEPRHGRSRLWFELACSADSDLEAEVERLVSLGATLVGAVPRQADEVELADPDGREFRLRRG